MSYLPLDGPSIQGTLSVGTGSVVEVKIGANVYPERQAITIQPEGKIYIFFATENNVPTTTDVSTKGFIIFKNAKETYEVGEAQKVYILSVSGTVNVRVAERS